MSFNQNTKINNLYQIVYPIIDIQDVSGSLLPDVSNNYNYSNNLTLQGASGTYDTINLGTITKPVNFTTTLPTNFYIRITGEANPGSLGYMEGGAWIKDVNGNTIAQLNIGNDRGISSGLFDISNNTVVANLSPSQFPLSVQEYVYYLGWAIYGNATTFTCNVVMTPDFPNYSQAYYSPLLNKFGYLPILSTPSNNAYVYAYQNSFGNTNNSIPSSGGNIYLTNFTAELGDSFQYNGISTFTCNLSGTYLLSIQNSCVNNSGTSQSNLTLYFEINGLSQNPFYDSTDLASFSNNSQTIRKSLNSGDLIKFYVGSTNYIRITNTYINITKI